tara:strand:+ start:983 stop:1234 length:252 start_codon:yes stop_codon:yes gene_type:complete
VSLTDLHIAFVCTTLVWGAAFWWGRQKMRQSIPPICAHASLADRMHDLAMLNRAGRLMMFTAATAWLLSAVAYCFFLIKFVTE